MPNKKSRVSRDFLCCALWMMLELKFRLMRDIFIFPFAVSELVYLQRINTKFFWFKTWFGFGYCSVGGNGAKHCFYVFIGIHKKNFFFI